MRRPKASPWQIDSLKPIQVASIDQEAYLKARAEFTTEEWMDVLMQSMGFNPQHFERQAKLLVNLELGALLVGKLGVVQKIAWLLNSPQSTLFLAYASSIRTWI